MVALFPFFALLNRKENTMANNLFVLDDGTKEITIENPFHEEICKIHIRPGDLSIIDRYNELTDRFGDIVAPLANVDLKNDGTSETVEGWDTVKKVENDLIERLNRVFDSRDIGNIFKNRNAFSTVGGEFYVERVISMLGDVVQSEMAEENKKVQKRLNKYTNDLKA